MSLRRVFVLVLCILAGSLGVACADDTDALRTMLALSMFPNGEVQVGALPTDGFTIPQPSGLRVLGSITGSSNGKVTSEVLYYEAIPGSAPSAPAYAYGQKLISAGWRPAFSPIANIFASALTGQAAPQTMCKAGMPTINVRAVHEYLIVRVDVGPGICASLQHMPGSMQAPSVAKAPYPVFAAPDGSTFVGGSKQTFNGVSHLASIGINSSLEATVILSGLAQQMVNAGWKSKTALASDGDTQAFAIKDKDGVDWIAALSVVSIAPNEYLFTASAFKTTETGTSSVSAAR
jgi:hypothetical protein